MLFIRLLVACTLLGSVHSAMSLSSEDVASKVTDQVQTNFYKYIDNLFKSDRFEPAGLAKAKSLQATSYSTTGFLKQSVFTFPNGSADSSCSSVTYVTGYAVNVCFQSSNYAFMFKLTTGASDCTGGVVQYFNDRHCDLYLGSSSLAAEQNVCSAQTSTGGVELNGYQQLTCTTAAAPVLFPNSVTSGLYLNTKCTGSPFGYVNFSPTKCNVLNMGSGENPYYVQYTCPSDAPGFSIYQATQCVGTPNITESFSATCSDGSDDLSDDAVRDDYVPPFVNPPPSVSTTALPGSADRPSSSNYYCTARAPTLAPVIAPTAFPTAAVAAQVSFSVKQIIRGIDADTFNANPVNAQVLIQTIADTIGVAYSDIQDFGGGRRRLSVHLQGARRLQAGSTASFTAKYTVSTLTTRSADELLYQLTTAMTSGAFTTDLNANAASTGGNEMVGTSSNSFASDSKKKELSAGAIAGIVIGCIAFVVIVIALSWFCCCRKDYSQV